MGSEQHDMDDLETGGISLHVRHEPPEEIVIVGGGIGGLAFACALHRVGLNAVVLEQSNKLRAEGVSIALWTNAMRVLQVLELADRFRSTSINIQRIEIYNDRNETLQTLDFSMCEGGPHEMQIVERKALLEALAGQLPEGTIRFNSRVRSIKKPQTLSSPFTDVELQDGSTYSAKVVVGFDGANSMTGSWMGLEKPKAIGEIQIRGMAVFSNNHGLGEFWRTYLGTGVRVSIVPMMSTKFYWFVIYTDYSEDWRDMTPEQIKQEALKLTQGFQSPLPHLCINNTPLESLTKNTLRERSNTRPSNSQVVGNVTVAGDASHPTSPMLGQGGCMALEDAIILTQKLHQALIKPQEINQTPAQYEVPESERVHQALLDFHAERHERTHALTYKASMRKATWNIKALDGNPWVILLKLNCRIQDEFFTVCRDSLYTKKIYEASGLQILSTTSIFM